MEQVSEQVYKHVCKLCSKRYPTGKSLGGHMRSHVIANAKKNKPISPKVLNLATVVDDVDVHDHDDDDNDDDEINGGDQKSTGYVLRENPKKTWRLVDATLANAKQPQQDLQDWVCKQCGKGFHSLKALCGHMSSHSEKEKNFKEQDDDISWSSDSKEQMFLAMESHSDNHQKNTNVENNSSDYISKRQTRSSLSKYRGVTAVDSVSPGGDCGGSGGGGSSSNLSEIDQLEQEEVAMCLMMLSRDSSGHKGCFNFGAESSDDSVILESKYVGIGARRNDLNFVNGKEKIEQVIVVAKKDVNVMNEINNSDSGYFENGAKELESDDSVDGFVRNYGLTKSKIDFGSKFIGNSFYSDDESRKRAINFNFDSPESDENNSKKIMKQDYYCYDNGNNNNGNSIKKGSRYECSICDRTFKTHQALGGHIISHRKTGYNNIDTTITGKQLSNSKNLVAATSKIMASNKSKKLKGHKCPYCPRVFKSGQALGGHKRTHTIEGGNRAIVNLHLETEKSRIEEPAPPPPPEPEPEYQQPHLIDLNLPAPMED